MKWKAKNKTEKLIPELGDKKEVIRYALFPTKVQTVWLWFENYIAVKEYKRYYYEYEEIVSQGILTEKYRVRSGVGERWETIERKLITKTNIENEQKD